MNDQRDFLLDIHNDHDHLRKYFGCLILNYYHSMKFFDENEIINQDKRSKISFPNLSESNNI